MVDQRRLVDDTRQASGRGSKVVKNVFVGLLASFSELLLERVHSDRYVIADQGLQVGDGNP